LFEKIPRNMLTLALEGVNALIRPADNVYYQELDAKYKTVRCFPAGLGRAHSLSVRMWLASRSLLPSIGCGQHGPQEARQRRSARGDQKIVAATCSARGWHVDFHAYTFCVLDELHTALRRRDVFVAPSWRYADPRAGLLDGAEWEATRPIICRTLGLSANPEPTLTP
jgi:hypothetical protein